MRAPRVKPAGLLLNVSLLALEIVIASWVLLWVRDDHAPESVTEPSPAPAIAASTTPERRELPATSGSVASRRPSNDALFYGRVVTADGAEPIGGVDVRVFETASAGEVRFPLVSRAITDTQGRFLSEFPSQASDVAAWVEAAGF